MPVGQVYEFNFPIYDDKGKKSLISIPVGVEGAGDEPGIADMIEIAEALELMLDPLTGGDIRSASVTIPLSIFSANTVDTNSDVEEGAIFAFTAEGTSKHKTMRLATFREALIVPNSDEVDRTDAEVLLLIDYIDNGFDVGSGLDTKTVRLCDSEGRVLDGIWSALEDFRRRKR